jgi:hypothetical protein
MMIVTLPNLFSSNLALFKALTASGPVKATTRRIPLAMASSAAIIRSIINSINNV